jgi:uncharacterized protein YndB with AHSA1/START domain
VASFDLSNYELRAGATTEARVVCRAASGAYAPGLSPSGRVRAVLKSLVYTGPSLQSLQTDYAKQGRIDTAAAVQSQAEVVVRASVARVWEVLADAPNWPAWMPGVTMVRLDSVVAPDATFTWKSGPSTIKSAFAVVDPEKELTWTGVAAGAKAVDRHTIEAVDGGTRVFTEESMAGPLLGLFFNSEKLQAVQRAYLAALKELVERAS